MAKAEFRVRVVLRNPGMLPELQARMQDLSPAFNEIYREWVDINAQKFELAAGGEASGAQIFEEFWQGLSPEYMKEKHGGGTARVTGKMRRGGEARFASAFPDWIMVRTGALRAAMTDPEALYHNIEPGQAVFGTPNDPDLADIVRWQSEKRPVVFLSLPDMNAVRRIIQDFFGFGGNFKSKRESSVGMLEAEASSMDAEFVDRVYE